MFGKLEAFEAEQTPLTYIATRVLVESVKMSVLLFRVSCRILLVGTRGALIMCTGLLWFTAFRGIR